MLKSKFSLFGTKLSCDDLLVCELFALSVERISYRLELADLALSVGEAGGERVALASRRFKTFARLLQATYTKHTSHNLFVRSIR